MYVNEYDIETAILHFDSAETTKRLAVARLIDRLVWWTNQNSDGWPYWQAPQKAAAKAIALTQGVTNADWERLEETDATEAEVKAALTPIKSFLTRHGASRLDRAYVLGSLG